MLKIENLKIRLKKTAKSKIFFAISGLAIIGATCFLLLDRRLNSVQKVLIVCMNNPVLTLLFIAVVCNMVLLFVNWNFVNEKSWFWRKRATILVSFLAIICIVDRGKINFTAVEKAQIRTEYRLRSDSIVAVAKNDYRTKEKGLELEMKEQKKVTTNLKKSFDSTVAVNSSLEEKNKQLQDQLSSVQATNCDSLVTQCQSLKDEIASLKESQKTTVVPPVTTDNIVEKKKATPVVKKRSSKKVPVLPYHPRRN